MVRSHHCLMAFVLGASSLLADTADVENCGLGPRPDRIYVKNIEPRGLGYSKGYSSLGLFYSTPKMSAPWISFLDLRSHVFNDGKFAANAGVGFRYLSNHFEEVFGLNLFYDYRDTDKLHYNQVSLGLEFLGQICDFRVNGYLPVGRLRSSPYDFHYSLYTYELTARRQCSMGGFDAEVGFHFPKLKHTDLYAAVGPYYYDGGSWGGTATGGRLRFLATLYTWLTLEASVTYDHLFRWRPQGAVFLTIPFSRKRAVQKNSLPSCSEAVLLTERLYQPVQHNEIIVTDKRRKNLN